MKLKHNKKRNTAFLFEVLVRELTKSVIQKKSDYGVKISRIVKEHFGKGTLLNKELEIYKSLQENSVKNTGKIINGVLKVMDSYPLSSLENKK